MTGIARTDFKGLTDTYMDTAAYNLDPMFQNLFLRDPREIDQRRITAYRYYMDFYNERQWPGQVQNTHPAFGGGPNIVDEEYNRRVWNITQSVVDKLVSFLVKEPWTIKLPAELEPEQEADEGQQNPIHDILEAVWRANSREQFSYDMAYMGCITGDCFIKVYYDEDFYADGMGELRFQVLDSRTVIPYFDGQDRNKMIGCRIQYPIFELQSDGSKNKVMYTEIHTDGNIVTFIDGEVQNVVPNPLGEMLVVHIKNEPLPYERFGRSDLHNLIIPQQEYNEKVSDLSEILAYHAAPVTIVKGARLPQLEKGARKVWAGIPEKGDVFNLELQDDGGMAFEYLDRLRKQMFELGAVPEEALGALQEVSNTSGAALHLQYQPLVERIQKKQICYGLGLRKLNGIILRFYEAVGALDLPEEISPSLKYQTFIEWGDALPRDRSLELTDIATEIGLGIESKRGALKRLGEENPDAKLEEIKQEAVEQAQMDFLTMGLSGMGGMGDDSGPGGPPGTKPGAQNGPQQDVKGAVNAAKTNPNTHGAQVSTQAVKRSAQTSTGQNKVRPQRP